MALGVVAVVWSLRPKPGPAADAQVAVWDVVPTEVEPLAGDAEASCSAAERLVLQKLGRVGTLDGSGVPARCKYLMHLEGWPEGEDECLLEFASNRISGIATESWGAKLAAAYYRRRQGGIMIFAGPTEGSSFISLDARWCSWSNVVTGIHAVP